MKNNKGITLVELIIVMSLVAMVLGIAGTFINFSFVSEKKTVNEYKIQSDLRLATEIINKEIRNSVVDFTLPADKFAHANDIANKSWSYLGIENNKDIVKYIPNESGVDRRQLLFSADSGINYTLNFVKNVNNKKLLEYTITAYDTSNNNSKVTISSQAEALNAIAVDEGGSLNNPAVAIAYRTGEVPTATRSTAAVAIVMDNSGSMAQNMAGGTTWTDSLKKGSILQTNVRSVLDIFAGVENVNVSLIPFSDNANSSKPWVKITSQNVESVKSDLGTSINGNGGTNMGDAMRRAYFNLQSFNTSNPGITIKNYMILVTDGSPTYASGTRSQGYHETWNIANWPYLISSANVQDGNIWGDGSECSQNITNSMDYVNKVGAQLIVTNATLKIKTYIIGLSSDATELPRLTETAISCTKDSDPRINAFPVYVAGNTEELAIALKNISDSILTEQWHIEGPYPVTTGGAIN